MYGGSYSSSSGSSAAASFNEPSSTSWRWRWAFSLSLATIDQWPKAAVGEFFSDGREVDCAIDWDLLADPDTLRAAQGIPRAQDTSYDVLDTPVGAGDRGRALGANPLAILVPCHRVTRGREVPAEYVGGAKARAALRALERA